MNDNTLKLKLLQEAVKLVPFDGWSADIIKKAAANAGINPAYAEMMFIGGVDELVDLFFINQDALLKDEIANLPLLDMRVRDRIAAGIWLRFKVNEPHKLLIKKTLPYLAMPWRWPLKTKILWRCVDLIWHEAGKDTSVDYNYYSKRTLLAGVFSASLMYWLSDNSSDYKDTKSFIARRIDDILQVAKFISGKK
jgi:ubiquinone biosynthesis protein COQ9